MDLDASISFWKSDLTDEQIAETIEQWRIALDNPDEEKSASVQQQIVSMTFFAPADIQWRFILIAAQRLEDTDHVGNFAAGPLEGFLGKFAEDWIDRLEIECRGNPKLRQALKGVWQHQMSDETYERVKVLANRLNS